MGMYNTLIAEMACPSCKEKFLGRYQFKFGMTWLLEYKIGDTITWGVPEIGHPGIPKVKAYGVIEDDEECPLCKAELSEHYDILIEKDVIISISPIKDMLEYLEGNGEYVIIN